MKTFTNVKGWIYFATGFVFHTEFYFYCSCLQVYKKPNKMPFVRQLKPYSSFTFTSSCSIGFFCPLLTDEAAYINCVQHQGYQYTAPSVICTVFQRQYGDFLFAVGTKLRRKTCINERNTRTKDKSPNYFISLYKKNVFRGILHQGFSKEL